MKYPLQRREIQVGDLIVINGPIGDHGITIMAERNGLSFSRGLKSDCAPLAKMIGEVLKAFPASVKFMRDATRGGVASVLNEIVDNRPFAAKIVEKQLPIRREVKGVCEILGIDPLYAANEGKVIMVVKKEDTLPIIEILKQSPTGKRAAVIGEIVSPYSGMVFVETLIRGRRILPLLLEDQLPRIC
jgi:hydrogenase expression/formation protein HypE